MYPFAPHCEKEEGDGEAGMAAAVSYAMTCLGQAWPGWTEYTSWTEPLKFKYVFNTDSERFKPILGLSKRMAITGCRGISSSTSSKRLSSSNIWRAPDPPQQSGHDKPQQVERALDVDKGTWRGHANTQEHGQCQAAF